MDKNKSKYTSSVRTNITISHDKLKTERQWAKEGFLAIDDSCGEQLWSNKFCEKKLRYLNIDEVKKATPDELDAYFRPERERAKIAQNKRMERKKKEEEEKKESYRAYIKELENQRNDALKKFENTLKVLKEVVKKIPSKSNIDTEIVVIDTETTGLYYYDDEILQISIIDDTGSILYHSYIKPIYSLKWDEATMVNGITPKMVENAPTIIEEMPNINSILYGVKKIIGYNIEFDLKFLLEWGLKLPNTCEIIDVMEAFASVYGEYSEYFGEYKWQKLSICAAYFGYEWGDDKAHDSLADCRATLYCYKKLREMEKKA